MGKGSKSALLGSNLGDRVAAQLITLSMFFPPARETCSRRARSTLSEVPGTDEPADVHNDSA